MTDAELRRAAEHAVERYFALAEERFGRVFKRVEVFFDLRGRTAGRGGQAEDSRWVRHYNHRMPSPDAPDPVLSRPPDERRQLLEARAQIVNCVYLGKLKETRWQSKFVST